MKTIIWSGGYDSTALILRSIRNREDFRTLSFTLGNNVDQSRREDQARRDIAAIIRQSPENSHYWGSHENIEIPSLIKARNVVTVQPILWTMYSALAYDGDIEFGYVRGDDVWHHRERLLTGMETLMNTIRDGQSSVRFVYPFEWETKHDLLFLYDGFEALMPLISTVEEGNDHWLVAKCKKGSEMRELWDALLQRKISAGVSEVMEKTERLAVDRYTAPGVDVMERDTVVEHAPPAPLKW